MIEPIKYGVVVIRQLDGNCAVNLEDRIRPVNALVARLLTLCDVTAFAWIDQFDTRIDATAFAQRIIDTCH